jgi:hypothetical protein
MLGSVFRVICPGGRLVIYSLCPQESADWLYYEYFPEALHRAVAAGIDAFSPQECANYFTAAGYEPE